MAALPLAELIERSLPAAVETVAHPDSPAMIAQAPGSAVRYPRLMGIPLGALRGQSPRREPQGTVGWSTASVRAPERNAVICWYSGSATMRLNASRLG